MWKLDFFGVVGEVASSQGGDSVGKSGLAGFAIGLTREGLLKLAKMNVKELESLQGILEANNGISSTEINNQILNKTKWIKRAGVVGNVVNGLGVTVRISQQGYASAGDVMDGVSAIVAFVPGAGWMVSTAITLTKENMIIMNRLSERGSVSDFNLYSGFAGPRW